MRNNFVNNSIQTKRMKYIGYPKNLLFGEIKNPKSFERYWSGVADNFRKRTELCIQQRGPF